MVLHGGLLHWAFNSWALWAFGPTLERLLGRVRFVALYVGTGLVGAGASFAFNQTTLGVGASGAIFGLLGALVAYFFRRRREGGSAPLQNLLLVLLLNLFIASRNPSIDNLAHIGGFLAGVTAMGLYDAVAPAQPRPQGGRPGRALPGRGRAGRARGGQLPAGQRPHLRGGLSDPSPASTGSWSARVRRYRALLMPIR